MPMAKLDEKKIRRLVKSRDGKVRNSEIASVLKITARGGQQAHSQYKATSKIPALKTPGRPRKPITSHEIEPVRQVREKFHTNAPYLEKIMLKLHDTKISRNRIHRIMPDEGLSAGQPRKKMRRKRIRCEREYSNSLWHTDWHAIRDSRWAGRQLIAFEDNASRFITAMACMIKQQL